MLSMRYLNCGSKIISDSYCLSRQIEYSDRPILDRILSWPFVPFSSKAKIILMKPAIYQLHNEDVFVVHPSLLFELTKNIKTNPINYNVSS